MTNKTFTVSLNKNPIITMDIVPGHFTTSHFHVTHYLDLNNLKTNALLASDVAIELALPYLSSTLVDTIVCMEGTEVIGAYMAKELLEEGTAVMNRGKEIHVITPIRNVDRKLMFQSSVQELISNRNIILLVPSISSGTTVRTALECISYYRGRLVGISALFDGSSEGFAQEINSMFTSEDIPGYQIFTPGKCPMCREGQKLDAIIIHDGYTNI